MQHQQSDDKRAEAAPFVPAGANPKLAGVFKRGAGMAPGRPKYSADEAHHRVGLRPIASMGAIQGRLNAI